MQRKITSEANDVNPLDTGKRELLRATMSVAIASTVPFTWIGCSHAGDQYPRSAAESSLDDTGINWNLDYPPGDARRFGVVGDGKANDHRAISFGLEATAASAGTTLSLTAGEFRIGRPLVMRSNVALVGVGRETHILSDGSDQVGIGKGIAILFGSMDAEAFTSADFVETTAGKAGTRSIRLRDSAELGKFSAGDLIWLWSKHGYKNGKGNLKPALQQINKIISINSETGDIDLDSPLYADFPEGGRLSKTDFARTRAHVPPFMTEAAQVANLRVSSAGNGTEAWSRFGGAYKARIENIWLESSNVCFSANGFAHSVIRGIQGRFHRKITDIAYFCHHNTFEDFEVELHSGSTQKGWGIRFAEGAHHNIVRNIQANVGDVCKTGGAVVFGQGSVANTVENVTISGKTAREIISARNGKGDLVPHEGNRVSNSRFVFDTASEIVSSKAAGPGSRMGLTVNRNEFVVATVGKALIAIKSSGCEIVGNQFNTGPGKILVNQKSENWTVEGNTFSSKPDVAGATKVINKIMASNRTP